MILLLFFLSRCVEIFLIGLVNVREPLLGMLEAIPWLAWAAPMENAGILESHILPLIDGLHLDIPRKGEGFKVLPDGQCQGGLTAHLPVTEFAVLEGELANLFGQALRPPSVEIYKVNTCVEGGFDAPVGDGVAVHVLGVEALRLALDGDGGDGIIVVILEDAAGHLHDVALDDGIGVDPHGLLNVGEELAHYEADVVGEVAVEIHVLPLRLVTGVGVDEVAEIVLVLELLDGVKPNVGHALQRLVADEVEDDVTGSVGLYGTDGGLGTDDGTCVGGVNEMDGIMDCGLFAFHGL
mmetsp:Transcript_133/g.268  ORF Transcript_133/g.268 Transcript_133/m.268 type:complete len:295 (-) Transcript_133:348-1232(-)